MDVRLEFKGAIADQGQLHALEAETRRLVHGLGRIGARVEDLVAEEELHVDDALQTGLKRYCYLHFLTRVQCHKLAGFILFQEWFL